MEVGPRLARDIAAKAHKGRRRARSGERAGSGPAGAPKPHTAAPGPNPPRHGSAGERPRGKRELRFRDLAELALEEKRKSGIRNSSLRADRVRLGVLNPVIGSLKTRLQGANVRARSRGYRRRAPAQSRQLQPLPLPRFVRVRLRRSRGNLEVNPLAAGRGDGEARRGSMSVFSSAMSSRR